MPESGPSKRLSRIEAAVWKLASRRWTCIFGFALLPVLLRVALLPWIPPPQPGIQDEFSYLLASDTFVSGRLTNPPHPLWVFFESTHIIQQPTYMSKYPPLTGLVLAFGQEVFGHPWAGILLSIGILCGVLAWAAYNWLAPTWAFTGATLAVLKIGILSYWSESYWGGNGAAIGGALLVGSLPALIRRPRFLRGIPPAIGIALLANSRPFEGLMLTAICIGYLAWRMQRKTNGFGWLKNLAGGFVAPLLLVMVPVGAWMAYYDVRVTGSAWVLPYTAHDQQYTATSPFLWEKARNIPVYRHDSLRHVWVDWDLKKKNFQREHFVITRFIFLGLLAQFYFGISLAIATLLCTPALARRRRTRDAFWLMVLFLGGLSLELGYIPHYGSPATVLFYIAAAGALQILRHWWPGRDWMAQTFCGALLITIILELIVIPFLPVHRFLYDKRTFQAERAGILEVLKRGTGKKLVFVHYGPHHNLNEEWIYNSADIDRSPIVWARSMGLDKDRELIAYYQDREVWLLDEDGRARITPYGVTAVEAWRDPGGQHLQ